MKKKGLFLGLLLVGAAGASVLGFLTMKKQQAPMQVQSQMQVEPQQPQTEVKISQPQTEVRISQAQQTIELVPGWIAFSGTYTGTPDNFVPVEIWAQSPPVDLRRFPKVPQAVVSSSNQIAGLVFYVYAPEDTTLNVIVEGAKAIPTYKELREMGWNVWEGTEEKEYASLVNFPVFIYVDKALIGSGRTGDGIVSGKVAVSKGYHEVQVLITGSHPVDRFLSEKRLGNLAFLNRLSLKVGFGLSTPEVPSQVFVEKKLYDKYAGKPSPVKEKLLEDKNENAGAKGK